MEIGYLFVGVGIWCLYYAWRGIVPNAWNPGGKHEIGKSMRRSTRFIYALGGVMLTGLGLVFLLHHRK